MIWTYAMAKVVVILKDWKFEDEEFRKRSDTTAQCVEVLEMVY